MEKDIRPELVVGVSLGLLAISLCSFSKAIKKQVREEQESRCDNCGTKPKKLQIHHRVPESLGGVSNRQNAVGLCPPDHKYYDRLALENHIIYPNIPIKNAPDSLFKKGLTRPKK